MCITKNSMDGIRNILLSIHYAAKEYIPRIHRPFCTKKELSNICKNFSGSSKNPCLPQSWIAPIHVMFKSSDYPSFLWKLCEAILARMFCWRHRDIERMAQLKCILNDIFKYSETSYQLRELSSVVFSSQLYVWCTILAKKRGV